MHREEEERRHAAAEREDAFRKMHEGDDGHPPAEVLPYHEYHDEDFDGEFRGRRDFDQYRFEVDEFSDDEHHHTFDDRQDERLFSIDHYNQAAGQPAQAHHTEPPKKEHHGAKKADHHAPTAANELAAATSVYLDTTVTKFLQNDISVTKFLERANDITVTKFLDVTVTKFLDENDISVTKFLS